nr:putative reverse transcriptase domain-containing protein [Tanacetum cinerariifolium]
MLVEQQVAEEGDVGENVENVNVGVVTEGVLVLLMMKFLLLMKNHPFHLLHHLLYHHNHLKISLPLPRRIEHLELDKVSQAMEITKLKQRVKKLERRNKVKVLKLRSLQKVRTTQRVETFDETMMDDVSNQERMIAEMGQDADVVLEDDKKVADDVKDVQDDIDEIQVPTVTLTAAPVRVIAAPSRRRKGGIIRDPQEESTTSTIIPAETKSTDKGKGILVEGPKPLKKQQQIKQDKKYARELKAGLNKNINWDEVIDHVKKKAKEDPTVKKYQALKRKLQTEAQARKNMMLYLKNVAGFKMDYFKGMSYDDIRPIFEVKFNSNLVFLQKTKEQIEEEESRALKRLNETPAEKVAKRRKLDEEVEVLKRHLQIVPNEDDDVYTEATPLARKLILLVERKYPLTRFTLDPMLNAVRLKVEEESEVSLDLLSFGVDAAKELKKNMLMFNADGERFSAVLKRIGDVAYKLDLPEELSIVHNTFHVSNLKKCHADEPLVVPLDGLHFDEKLQFVEEPVEIVDREVKRLKQSRIPLVKIRWNFKRGPEFTWEREDQFQKKYPHLLARTASTSTITS